MARLDQGMMHRRQDAGSDCCNCWTGLSSNMVRQCEIVPDRICSTSETSLVGLGQQSSHSSPNLPGSDLLLPVWPSKAVHLGLHVMSAASN